MFLYYQDRANYEGCDHCEEMALRYMKRFRSKDDYLWESEDLAWFKDIAPDTVFMRTAILLIKMFLFSVGTKVVYKNFDLTN